MNKIDNFNIDPTLDLVLERRAEVPVELVWEAWTHPEHLKEWFCPRPWGISECRVDLRPGGEFYFSMRSPEGQEFPNTGCFLEIVPGRKLVWTSCLLPGYRPLLEEDVASALPFSAVVLMEPDGKGTKYTAIAIHRDPDGKQKHEAMGFYEGWGTVFEQLVEYINTRLRR